MKPEFIDNRDGNTLAGALCAHLRWLAQTYAAPVELAIATGYFNPRGFALLADDLQGLARVRLLLGAEPTPPPATPRRKPGEPRGEQYDARRVRRALQAHERGLAEDRDILGFTVEVDATLQRLLDFLESGRIEVRRYEQSFLHGKAFIFAGDEGVISGSSNFTAAGLIRNLELNMGRYDPTPVRKVQDWFDDLWEQASPYDLASIYAARYVEYDPYLIYLRVLWELYGEELEAEHGTDAAIPLTTFQNDGVFRSKRILERYNGVIVADGVGLGKTYIGGELLREAIQDRRQRALLIAPAALRDGPWDRFRDHYQLYFESISYEQLADEWQLGGEHTYLRNGSDEYALVVIDEAQAFRNPSTRRALALRRLLQGSPPKHLVLLSATPVNNSLWDLYYLLTYFVGHDAAFADRGVRSLRERFKQAVARDPYDLRPDMLFDVLDTVTVRRTRHFVRRYYPHDVVPGPNGTLVPIRFPEPHVERVTYELDDVLPGFFDEFAEALAPEEGDPELSLARYWPSRYRFAAEADHREVALVGLLRSGLLKRFESSAYAFACTAARMADSHDAFLAALDAGYIPTPEAIDEWAEADSDEVFEALLRESGAEPVAGFEVDRLRSDVEGDRHLLRHFADLAGAVAREDDPKLTVLQEELAETAAQAEAQGIDEEDVRDKRKVIIFSYYADTVDWIEQHLLDVVQTDPRLACYRGRIVSVASQDSRRGVSREAAIFGFAPRSSEAPPGRDEDRFDILVTTDVLAEGQNLQECANIINYDLPWNPMRLVQRHGRIDRIGSHHDDVYIRCFFPDRRLERLLELEQRIRRKLAQAAASIGIESEVIPAGAVSEVVFAETRDEIEALRSEDASLFVNAGEDPSAHSGEEYRQELRQGLDTRGREIKELPWAAGSGFAHGQRKGHFFCARVGDRRFLRFVPMDEGEVISDTLGCLRLITCTDGAPRYMADDLRRAAYDAWETARRDIYEEWTYATDPANLQPKVRPVFRDAANHLRRYPPAGVVQGELDRLLDSLEAPWGRRIERQFREILDVEVEDPLAVSQQIVNKVRELGLQPFVAPEPLPVIEEDEVQLICWMAVEAD